MLDLLENVQNNLPSGAESLNRLPSYQGNTGKEFALSQIDRANGVMRRLIHAWLDAYNEEAYIASLSALDTIRSAEDNLIAVKLKQIASLIVELNVVILNLIFSQVPDYDVEGFAHLWWNNFLIMRNMWEKFPLATQLGDQFRASVHSTLETIFKNNDHIFLYFQSLERYFCGDEGFVLYDELQPYLNRRDIAVSIPKPDIADQTYEKVLEEFKHKIYLGSMPSHVVVNGIKELLNNAIKYGSTAAVVTVDRQTTKWVFTVRDNNKKPIPSWQVDLYNNLREDLDSIIIPPSDHPNSSGVGLLSLLKDGVDLHVANLYFDYDEEEDGSFIEGENGCTLIDGQRKVFGGHEISLIVPFTVQRRSVNGGRIKQQIEDYFNGRLKRMSDNAL